MASALMSAPLGTTPPQYSRTPKRGSGGIVAFRSNTSDDAAGSVSRTPSSLVEFSSSWRSLSRSSRDTNESGRLRHNASIPKSASFVKVEGFETTGTTPVPSPPASPEKLTMSQRGPSLLTRELSLDTSVSAAALAVNSSETSAFVQRLEERVAIKLEPVPRPAPLTRQRSSLPDDLLEQMQSRYPVFKEPLVVRAFNISRLAHDGRYDGLGGEPAFIRCASAAAILAELGADEPTIAAALLHDALDRTMLLEGQLRAMMGSGEVIDLVKRVSHVGYVCGKFLAASGPSSSLSHPSPFAEASASCDTAAPAGVVDMLVAHCPPRALLVRLAVALQETRALDARPPSGLVTTPRSSGEKRRLAADALAVWAPLANRLGVWSLKAELEDRAFRTLHPTEHAALKERLEEAQSPARLVALADRLRAELQAEGIEYVDLSGRPKHLWGVWCKMQTKGYRPEQVADVRGLRVIVKTREDCYRAMRAVERAWHVIGPAKNYIKTPKANGYQSLHTVADVGDGHSVEIQIRTDKMHYLAEYGAQAAHWRYKERASPSASAGAETGGGVAQETSWAKFVTSRQVASDKKCRPSGSPAQDQSLDSILASIDLGGEASPGSSPPTDAAPGARQSRTFVEYLEVSGQRPAPPAEQTRALVAVVAEGGCCVVQVPIGTTLEALLERCGASLAPRGLHAIVNRHLESNPQAVVQAGDIVELYPEPAAAPAALPPRPLRTLSGGGAQGNLMPLGKLRRPAMAASSMS